MGFRVDTAEGRLGTVVGELRRSHGWPECLVVRRGLFRADHVLVPLSDVERVEAGAGLVLARGPVLREEPGDLLLYRPRAARDDGPPVPGEG